MSSEQFKKDNIILGVFFLVVAAMSFSCASTKIMWQGKQVTREQAAKEYFDECEETYKRGDVDFALKKYKHFLKLFNDNEYTDGVYFRIGLIYFEKGRRDASIENWGNLIRKFPKSEYNYLARYYLGWIFFDNKNYLDTISILSEVDYGKFENNPKMTSSFFHMLSVSFLNANNWPRAVSWMLKERSYIGRGPRYDEIEALVANAIESKLTINELKSLLPTVKNEYPENLIYFKLINTYYAQKDLAAVEEYASNYLKKYSQEQNAPLVQEILSYIDSVKKLKANKIGVILPLSGKYEVFGMRILKGIMLAMSIFRGQDAAAEGSDFTLEIRDTKSESTQIENLVDDLILEENVMAIVGPLSHSDSVAAAAKAQNYKVPLITFSQDENISDAGDYIFRCALTKSAQVKKLLSFAMGELGIKKFAILYPEHPYGSEFANMFWEEVDKNMGEVTAIESYAADQKDFSPSIKKLLGKDKPSGGVIDFEAIFIPDQVQNVGLIAPSLVYNDVTGVQLLGVSSWNSKTLIQRAGENVLQGAVFTDGYFNGVESPKHELFLNEYKTQYKEDPDMLAVSGYEAMDIMKSILVNPNIKTREEFKSAFLLIGDYDGVASRLHIYPNGDIDRDVFVLTIDDGEIIQYAY